MQHPSATILSLAATFLIFSTLLIAGNVSTRENRFSNQAAGLFFVQSITEEELRLKHASAFDAPRILIVPGHDKASWGTQFKNTKEEELNAELGIEIYNRFVRDPRYNVILARDANGFHPEIETFIEENEERILAYQEKQKVYMEALVEKGLVDTVINVEHNNAANRVVLQLYGINLWANENNIDLVLHLHFNDYPRRNTSHAGKYSGFSIYVPEEQYSNAKASRSIAEFVFEELAGILAVSNQPKESVGIIDDQELIAVGAFNTLDPASLLIEYGYIYETQFLNERTREALFRELAERTYTGVGRFFGDTHIQNTALSGLALIPHSWHRNISEGERFNTDVLALQVALIDQKTYPPPGKSKNTCPVTGNFGPCTKKGVVEFQKKHGISPASGFVGPQTRAKLNELYGEKAPNQAL